MKLKFQFAFMSHFFANPLSSLLADNDIGDSACLNLAEAVRNVPSFRKYDPCLSLAMKSCLLF